MLAFEHEVDAEEDGGEDVEDVREPARDGADDVGADGSGEVFGLGGECIHAELVGHGKVLEAGEGGGNAGREVGEEAAEVAQDGGQAEDKEEGEAQDDGEQ